jgi:phosphotransferase system  glucose/maltose/N-acetylglucosamine-specific IIC component
MSLQLFFDDPTLFGAEPDTEFSCWVTSRVHVLAGGMESILWREIVGFQFLILQKLEVYRNCRIGLLLFYRIKLIFYLVYICKDLMTKELYDKNKSRT